MNYCKKKKYFSMFKALLGVAKNLWTHTNSNSLQVNDEICRIECGRWFENVEIVSGYEAVKIGLKDPK